MSHSHAKVIRKAGEEITMPIENDNFVCTADQETETITCEAKDSNVYGDHEDNRQVKLKGDNSGISLESGDITVGSSPLGRLSVEGGSIDDENMHNGKILRHFDNKEIYHVED